MRITVSADIIFKDYYNKFINKSKTEVANLNNQINAINDIIDRFYLDLLPRREYIKHVFGLDINRYIEFNNKEFNPINSLYKKVSYINRYKYKDEYKNDINSLLNYCSAINKKQELIEEKELAEIKANMNYNTYQNYVFEYYNKVEEILLMGEGYTFNNGIGCISINRFKASNPIKIDIKETGNNYRKIISEGKIPYDKSNAEFCKNNGIEYNGVKYKVNKIVDHVYRIFITNTDKRYKCKISFTSANYINSKYRKSTYQEIVDTYCHNLEDIFRLQVSIDVKLKLLLIKFPGYYVNFVRDVNKQ